MAVSDDLLTVSEAATVAGVSVRTMRRWANSGHVRTVGSGHGRKVVAASISKAAAIADTNGQETGHSMGQVSATVATETVRSATSDTAAIEADRLADLVRELTGKLAEQAALTAVWMERARVLGERLALAPPDAPEPQQDAILRPDQPGTRHGDAPVPLTARLRALVPWMLAVLAIVAVIALLTWPR